MERKYHRLTLLRILLIMILIFWFILMIKFTLFKHQWYVIQNYFRDDYPFYELKDGWLRANFVPFKTILQIINTPGIFEYRINNNLGNLLGFTPLGLLLPTLFKTCKKASIFILTAFCISLFFESLQLITGLGIFDIDDLILNTIGAWAGFFLMKLISRQLRVCI